MNIYLVSRDKCDYDEFDSFVVASKSGQDALDYLEKTYNTRPRYTGWPNEGSKTAELVGTTDKYTETTVISSSFNAG